MRSPVIVECDSITDSAAGVSEVLKTLTVNALFFKRAELQTVVANELRVFAGCKNQPVVAAEQE